MTLNTIIHASSDQVSCDLGGEAAILNLNTGAYYGLDPVGARVWSLLATPQTVADVRDAMLAEYEVDAGRCESDLLALLDRLADEGLIEIRDAASRQTPPTRAC
jgi:Coenzyme PQQ synthesis protein D (PqqD)